MEVKSGVEQAGRIVVTGGGSGGHITPILAVAHELKQLAPKVQIIYIGQRGDSLGDIPAANQNIDQVHTVRAGKFRRYHRAGLMQLLDLKTLALNIRDAFFVLIGLWQSFWLLRRLRPNVIFIKGGFVGVPVGLSAALLKIPYITHDSDALPGLANRIIARWAMWHAVGLPKSVYKQYPLAKTITVGVPISHEFGPVGTAMVAAYRLQLGLDEFDQIICVTGGGLGAQRLNQAVVSCVPELLNRYPQLAVVHIAGRKHEASLRQQYKRQLKADQQRRVVVKGFITNLHQYSGAADVIVTRAGATAIAEFAAQAKPCVVVPNPQLTGGHQLKNALALAERKAIRVVNEDVLNHDHRALMPPLTDLLDHPDRAQALGTKLASLARPDAARRLAMLLLDMYPL